MAKHVADKKLRRNRALESMARSLDSGCRGVSKHGDICTGHNSPTLGHIYPTQHTAYVGHNLFMWGRHRA